MPKSINQKLTSINRFIIFINNNPKYNDKIVAEIKLLKVQEQYYLENLLEYREYERMLNRTQLHKDQRAYLMFKTLYHTGARVSEFLQIEPQHVLQDKCVIKGKGNKYREIFIPSRLKEELKDYNGDINYKKI
ncbi:site-specific integrase [Vallitalea okinawensis]|uniref:site-specific integrase n=1 Tax=Vallitalea okinawensis TaxID=2078660 RepID=UPI000CFDBA10|nr:site-specific integrase [Vallitalea okinawensis]